MPQLLGRGVLIQRAALVVAALVVVVLVWRWRRRQQQREQALALSALRRTCASLQGQASIFVGLLLPPSSAASPAASARAAAMVASLFSQAACPFRVYMGIVQLEDAAALQARGLLAAAPFLEQVEAHCARGRYGARFSDHVRLLRMPTTEFQGVHHARRFLWRHAFQGQTFAMWLGDAASLALCADWDAACLAQLRLCRNPRALLTTVPGLHAQQPTFAVAARMALCGLPCWGARLQARPTGAPLPTALFSFEFAFGPAGAWQWLAAAGAGAGADGQLPQDLPWLLHGEDALASAALASQGWSCYAPGLCICWALQAPQGGEEGAAATVAGCTRAWVKAVPEFRALARQSHAQLRMWLGSSPWCAQAGLDMSQAVLYGRARMGTTAAPTDAEIRGKYGSLAAFTAEKQALSLAILQA